MNGGGQPTPGAPRLHRRRQELGPGVADVVIVGGGPAGLLLASELALHRLAVTLVEQLPAIIHQPKAGTIHARPAQLLRRRGYLPPGPLTAAPGALAHASFHFAAQATFPVTSPAAEGPPIVAQWQGDLEHFLEAVCRARGVEILRGHTARAVEQDEHGVRVTVRPEGPGAERTIHASYVVGADGARSLVRRAAGITATDHPATMRALLGRVHLTEPGRAPAGWQGTPRGWTLVNLDPAGLSRLITFEFGAATEDRAAPVTSEELAATAERIVGRAVPFDRVEFSGRFSDFSRVADTYRAGRLLLVGDAAHVHYPVGGQGLNLGIQDAFNLGWKLAMVLKGRAGDALLDTYTQERRPHAEWVIDYTRGQAAAMDPDPASSAARDLAVAEAASPAGQQRLGPLISSQAVTTCPAGATHRLAGRFLTDRAVATRAGVTRVSALLAHGRAVLLERAPSGGPQDKTLAALVARWHGRVDHVTELPRDDPPEVTTEEDDPPRAVLIRPDGYVAWATGSRATDGLEDALRWWFGHPGPPPAPPVLRADRRSVDQRTETVRRSTTPSA